MRAKPSDYSGRGRADGTTPLNRALGFRFRVEPPPTLWSARTVGARPSAPTDPPGSRHRPVSVTDRNATTEAHRVFGERLV
jgi:hypothetical protein